MSDIQMIYSDNPYMDVLVYNTKVLAQGVVIKNQTEADKYETLDTIKASDIYLACVEIINIIFFIWSIYYSCFIYFSTT